MAVKIGDKIRITEDQFGAPKDEIVVVHKVFSDSVGYYYADNHSLWYADWGTFEVVNETVNHPAHYGGGDNPYEVIKVAEEWGLDQDAYLFNVIKYVARAGKKHDNVLEDLKKADFYLDRRIANLEALND